LAPLFKRSADRLTDYVNENDRRRPLVFFLIFLTFVSPVLLIGTLSYRTTRRDLTDATLSRRQSIAYLAAEMVKEKLDRIADVAISLATRPRLRERAAAKNWADAGRVLAEVREDFDFVDRIFLVDPEGTSRAAIPDAPEVVGKNFAFRDWYEGVSRQWQPYVSQVYRRASEPHYNVVSVAVPIRGYDKGRIAGILLIQVRLDFFLQWINGPEVGPSGFVYLVDRTGKLVAHPGFPPQGEIVDFSSTPAVQKILRGERGVGIHFDPIEKEERISAYEPVDGYGWGAIAVEPTAAAFAAQKRALDRMLIIYGLIGLLSGSLAILVLHNMARERKTAEELRERNIELEKRSFQLHQANRLKSEFLANMSHELRTPLNAIIGFSELMHDGKIGPVSADHKEYLGDILISARHLLELINDILDLSKVEAKKMEFSPEPVKLRELIAEVREILQTIAAGKRIQVDLHVSPEVDELIIDPAKLKQVLYNYVSNALKFTADGGSVAIRALAEDEAFFRLEVEDTGIGIPASDLEKLFVEFQQLDSTAAKKHQGTGLGLALTKKIVQAQGGRVGVRSAPGRGSVFHAVLPKRPALPTGGIVERPHIAKMPEGSGFLAIESNKFG
jgi:signal transduction histidine kinase